MATTTVNAAESTLNVSSSQQVRDVSALAELDPDVAPFTLILQKARSRKASSFKVEWPEKVRAPKYDQINNGAGYASGATSVVVDNGGYFNVGDIVEVPRTHEKVRVTAVSTNTLTIVRGVGSTSAAAMVDNDDLFILGNAYTEGSSVGTEKSHQETWVYNYTQIFRHPFGATRTEQQTASYLGDNRTRLRREKSREHRIDIESAFLFGERNQDSSNTNAPRRYLGGMTYWMADNLKDAGGTLTEAEVWDWAEGLFTHTASGTKVLFVSLKVASVLDMLAGARLQTTPKDETYGISTKEWLTSHGRLMIVPHRLLVNGAGGQGYGNSAIAVDIDRLAERPLQSTQLYTDRQAPGDDKWTDEYLTETTLQFENSPLHGVLSNVTG